MLLLLLHFLVLLLGIFKVLDQLLSGGSYGQYRSNMPCCRHPSHTWNIYTWRYPSGHLHRLIEREVHRLIFVVVRCLPFACSADRETHKTTSGVEKKKRRSDEEETKRKSGEGASWKIDGEGPRGWSAMGPSGRRNTVLYLNACAYIDLYSHREYHLQPLGINS